ncbi:MAG: GNAT family N-acetyltransferase [Labilithrix sp.]|nr:GNAT family N-acetyltransferase [Labilithrix sp.]
MHPVAYRIETPRLVVRCWSPDDAPKAKKAEDESRESLRAFMPWADRAPETLTEVIEKLRQFRSWFDAGEDFLFGAFDKASGDVVGGTGLHPRVGKGGLEIGYWVHAGHHRKGIATEMAGALTRVAFELGRMRWVEIRCATKNVASAGVPPKLGFTHEATLRERLTLPSGEVDDALVFTLLARDYDASPAKRIAFTALDAAGRDLS